MTKSFVLFLSFVVKEALLAQVLVYGSFQTSTFLALLPIESTPPDCYARSMEEERQRVILYGDSLLLAGMQASLDTSTGLEVILLDQMLPDPMKYLHDLHPDTVIFDLGSTSPDFPMIILQQPGLQLIGVDPSNNKLLVFSSHPVQALSVADLVSIIHRRCR